MDDEQPPIDVLAEANHASLLRFQGRFPGALVDDQLTHLRVWTGLASAASSTRWRATRWSKGVAPAAVRAIAADLSGRRAPWRWYVGSAGGSEDLGRLLKSVGLMSGAGADADAAAAHGARAAAPRGQGGAGRRAARVAGPRPPRHDRVGRCARGVQRLGRTDRGGVADDAPGPGLRGGGAAPAPGGAPGRPARGHRERVPGHGRDRRHLPRRGGAGGARPGHRARG